MARAALVAVALTRAAAAAAFGLLLAGASRASAQGVEIAPFGGYRFGGDLFEVAARRALDNDGAPAVGLVLDIPLRNGFQIEGLFSHQEVHVAPVSLGPPLPVRVTVDHWQAGGLQEYGENRLRLFSTGVLGLTHYAADGDGELRFSFAAGGGLKLFANRHVGLRLDGRAFATFVDAESNTIACGGGGCLTVLYANALWQAEFTAGLFVRFP